MSYRKVSGHPDIDYDREFMHVHTCKTLKKYTCVCMLFIYFLRNKIYSYKLNVNVIDEYLTNL